MMKSKKKNTKYAKKRKKKNQNTGLVITFLLSCIVLMCLVLAMMVRQGEIDHKINETAKEDETMESTTALPQTLEKDNPNRVYLSNGFYYEPISEVIEKRIRGKSFGEDCTMAMEDLRYVRVLHYDFNGNLAEGELIVNKQVAQDVVEIFKELYDAGYQIEKIRLVDDYNANDEKSMQDNNTSAFNFRMIEGTTTVSDHSFGMAIDINPFYNPYLQQRGDKVLISPEGSEQYADRTAEFEHKIEKGDVCYKAFTKRGWKWGGEWEGTVDYQHFYKDLSKEE